MIGRNGSCEPLTEVSLSMGGVPAIPESWLEPNRYQLLKSRVSAYIEIRDRMNQAVKSVRYISSGHFHSSYSAYACRVLIGCLDINRYEIIHLDVDLS